MKIYLSISIKFCLSILIMVTTVFTCLAEDGYRLWLRYEYVKEDSLREAYVKRVSHLQFDNTSETFVVASAELQRGLSSMLGRELIVNTPSPSPGSGLILGVIDGMKFKRKLPIKQKDLGKEGYCIYDDGNDIIIVGGSEIGVLYGVFRLLSHIKRQMPIENIMITEQPKIKNRLLNHWDNLDGTVERGYAGFSIWNWHQLPHYIDTRYIDYARANSSIGINGTVVTNVNANELVFREDYIEKLAALADVFRPYGIKVYLTARFSSPIELGKLNTADPLHPEVKAWWQKKVSEIYEQIPDFGGFLVKANSEGQPGPQDFGRSHADGANMLADALAPYGGIVMWRAFVYSEHNADDRAKQAYSEFVPLDGQFRKNVLIQVKNGPIDFQPREPIHAMFGAMPETPIMMEFQITKEYLGQGTHLVGLSNMYEEVLDTDTYINGKGSTVAKVVDGTLHHHKLSGMAGVSNIGTARNWTGNLFGQADWYAFGRLAWDPYLSSSDIFKEWVQLTFEDSRVREVAFSLLNDSHEACVKYMTPLGLHHIMATGHHYGPGPWISELSRPEWNPTYYHKAEEKGLGFDRTESGSKALGQYHPSYQDIYKDINTCPLELLLWYHHVPWDHTLNTGNTLWHQLCLTYHEGVMSVTKMKNDWLSLEGAVDEERFRQVAMHLTIQEQEAKWWRDACLSYFQSFSNMEFPSHLEKPEHDLDYYKSLAYPYAPGIKPRW